MLQRIEAEAIPGTIRGDYALEIGFNIIHGSDGPGTAVQEINLFFRPEELPGYGQMGLRTEVACMRVKMPAVSTAGFLL